MQACHGFAHRGALSYLTVDNRLRRVVAVRQHAPGLGRLFCVHPLGYRSK